MPYKLCRITPNGVAVSSWMTHPEVQVTYHLHMPTVPALLGTKLYALIGKVYAEPFIENALTYNHYCALFECEVKGVSSKGAPSYINNDVPSGVVLENWLKFTTKTDPGVIVVNEVTLKRIICGYGKVTGGYEMISVENLPGNWRK